MAVYYKIMNIGDLKISKIQILIILLLILGIVVGVILVQRQQILKSKATQEIYNAFERTDAEGNRLECLGNSCETKTLDVKIKVNIEELKRLSNPD